MIHDLADGKIDAAVLWGPMAGYYAKQMTPPATVVPLVKERGPGPPMAFWIGMGVRYTDQEWKRQLNRMIQQNRGEMSAMLLSFGVPLLDENDHPITPASLQKAP